MVQLVKNLPAMRETWVQSLGWEDPLEKGTATHSSILAWRIPWTEEPLVPWRATVHGAAESDTTERLTDTLFRSIKTKEKNKLYFISFISFLTSL